RPHVAFLGRIPGTQRYSDLERHPDNERVAEIVIFRVEASLLYFNVDHVREVVSQWVEQNTPPRLVICDLSAAPRVDIAAARMLTGLSEALRRRHIAMRIVEAHAKVRDLLRAAGLEDRVGYLGRHMSIEQAIAELPAESAGGLAGIESSTPKRM